MKKVLQNATDLQIRVSTYIHKQQKAYLDVHLALSFLLPPPLKMYTNQGLLACSCRQGILMQDDHSISISNLSSELGATISDNGSHG